MNASSESDVSETTENGYCIFLHVVEGTGMQPENNPNSNLREHVGFTATLNGVKFEVQGHTMETSTIFNSNCIWESELDDIKRMKTDNRPLKLEFFMESQQPLVFNPIGTLLLPLRGIPAVTNARGSPFRLHWHKLGTLRGEWRQKRPEVYLLLSIVKRSLVEEGYLDSFMKKRKPSTTKNTLSPNVSETSLMLQSQSNIYVQLLERVGLLQVGNDPNADIEILHMTLTFQQVRNLSKILEHERANGRQTNVLQFNYDLLGLVSNVDIRTEEEDCHDINERLTISFKTSLRSLRVYFERIFYIPLNLRVNDTDIGNYHFNLASMLPEERQFSEQNSWCMNGAFQLRCSSKVIDVAEPPTIDYRFNIQLLNPKSNKGYVDMITLNNTLAQKFRNRDIVAGPVEENSTAKELQQRGAVTHRNFFTNIHNAEAHLERQVKTSRVGENHCDLLVTDDFLKEVLGEHGWKCQRRSICVGTEDLLHSESVCIGTEDRLSSSVDVAINTDELGIDIDAVASQQTEELGLKIVQELEEWKSQQMHNFLDELERKEKFFLANLNAQWSHKRAAHHARLEAKIAHCEQLDAKLQKAHAEIQAIAVQDVEKRQIVDVVKRDIEKNYAEKFQLLESQMQHLKLDMEEKSSMFEIKSKEVAIENTKLECEKAELRERVDLLEKQLGKIAETHMSTEELQDVLNNLRCSGDRLAKLEKSKNFYKEQWTAASREVHRLKLKENLKEQKKMLRKETDSYTDSFEMCLEEILSEEQEALGSDRTELKTIQDMLCLSSESSSVCEVEGE